MSLSLSELKLTLLVILVIFSQLLLAFQATIPKLTLHILAVCLLREDPQYSLK